MQHGLSYTTFSFSNVQISGYPSTPAALATKDDLIDVSVNVHNTGIVASAVVAQAYCGFQDSARVRIMRYARMLCAFTKVFLEPGASTNAR